MWCDLTLARVPLPCAANLRTRFANPFTLKAALCVGFAPGATVEAWAFEFFIGLAVAVVVDAVAFLFFFFIGVVVLGVGGFVAG